MKIKTLSLILLLAILKISHAQPWLNQLNQSGKAESEITLFDHQKAFNEYWKPFNVERGYYLDNEGNKRKAPGWKQFKRWEYLMETQVNPITGEFPKTTAEERFREFLQNNPETKSSAGNWISLGTSSSGGGYAGIGRLNCIAFHPSDNNTYWVGAPAGGLWVTSNNGSTWTCLTNDNAVLGVSDIAIPSDYATSQTIYIATGDRDAWDNNSVGVLKSTDGGFSWQTTGISYTAGQYKMVNRLLLSPTDNNTLLAATSGGVYKTTDGGTTWSTRLTTLNFIDMEYKPGDFNTLYGSNKLGDVYVSTDGGSNWTRTLNETGERVELAVSDANPAYVYALVADSDAGLYGVYRSTDSGSSFTQTLSGDTNNLLGWETDGSDLDTGQGWYDLSIAVSPTNENTLLVGGVNTWRSTDGGTNWTIVNHWYGGAGDEVHADKHMLKYRSNGDLFECNDGGVYISTNNGTEWTDKTNGIVISQMYKLSVSKTVQNEVITGLQDNGTKLLSGGSWSDVKGGDGMECLIDYTNAEIQYGTYVEGQIDRTMNHWSNSTDISPEYGGAWVTPYIIDPGNPQILYAGYSDIYKTTNRGDSWTTISTMNSDDNIRSMAIAPSNTSILYVADQTHIWKTVNGGSLWTEITGTLPTSGSITYIAVKNDDPNTLWVTLGGYTSSGVYQSIDGGSSWTNISAGLPSIPCNTIVQNKLNSTSVELYVGTDFGVFVKNGTENWISFNSGMPNVRIGELEIWYGTSSATSKLRAATYGRGLWESDLYSSPSNVAETQENSGIEIQSTDNEISVSNLKQKNINIRIINTLGQIVYSQKTDSDTRISLEKGIYIVNIGLQDNSRTNVLSRKVMLK